MQEKIILKRKIYNKILEQKEKYAPDYALFLKGARRVGKTTIAEAFGKSQYLAYVYLFLRNKIGYLYFCRDSH